MKRKKNLEVKLSRPGNTFPKIKTFLQLHELTKKTRVGKTFINPFKKNNASIPNLAGYNILRLLYDL